MVRGVNELMHETEERGGGNPLLWMGPLIAIPGFFSYWGFFVRWPALRDTAWLNIGILLVALAVSILGLRRAWSRGGWRRLAGIGGTSLSALLLVGLVAYCYGLSYRVPSADDAIALGEDLPAITLASHDGSPIDLATAAEQPLVLVFYRGFW